MKHLLRAAALIGTFCCIFAFSARPAASIPTSACCRACINQYNTCEPAASEACYSAYLNCIAPCNDRYCPI